MSDTAQMLFNLQKFQILRLYTDPNSVKGVTHAYAYAWDAGVYPYADEFAVWHAPYKEHFQVSEEMVVALVKFLDDLWINKKSITFYDLESHYGVSGSASPGAVWDRWSLISACRYMKLHGMFDDTFWQGLVGHSNCPSESHCIVQPFGPGDIYFL
ncbi:hypothetical protein N5C93_17080 [Pseudomonas nitroreducens]|uniref:hypothetical protein n=1 Tax=Pseudomonas nitroreducens TaxID=46680 RepID=UPI00244840FD|nr:hypothetical protein [Pseudomonas nitroreducens]MDH1074558.1 hypothetical protein [Pseudomonas nitroreducens]